MAGFTIYLDEMEKRERKQRRRARVLGAVAIIAVLVAMRPPKPEQEVVIKEDRIPVGHIGTRTETLTKTVEVEKRVPVPLVAPMPLIKTPFTWPAIDIDPFMPMRHLCVTPERMRFSSNASDELTVSNPGNTPIRIGRIVTAPERSGFVVNGGDCANRELAGRERCTIFVALHEAHGEMIHVVIESDDGDKDVRVEAPTAAPAAPATPASAT